MKKSFASSTLMTLLFGAVAANAQFIINSSPGLFDPSFRGSANTTWFGWSPGSFDGAVDNELIDNPSPTIGTAPGGLSFTQTPANDILSGGNNIYSGFAGTTDLLLDIPTSGTVGSGFTTIIVQGRTAFGGYAPPPTFNPISGFNPTVTLGDNTSGQTQFWAKYEIAGNQPIYNLSISLALASSTSIAELELDTQWSATSFASDTAVVPETSTFALLGVGIMAGFTLKRRFGKNR